MSENDFEDLLSNQGFSSRADRKGPRTIAEMRRQDQARDSDPLKLKVQGARAGAGWGASWAGAWGEGRSRAAPTHAQGPLSDMLAGAVASIYAYLLPESFGVKDQLSPRGWDVWPQARKAPRSSAHQPGGTPVGGRGPQRPRGDKDVCVPGPWDGQGHL